MKLDKERYKELGISFEEKTFYDILVSCAKKFRTMQQGAKHQFWDLLYCVRIMRTS
ncbi:MAG: hypothetical protein IJU92_02160 [Spirochaetaceae bacterium]|nr:hypothetical protein [Spirochaetaceae bacterium]